MATATLYAAMRIVHLTTGGVWAGWTVFMAALVVPAARDGRLDADAVTWLCGRFARLSQLAPVVMLLTGMYMVGAGVPTDALLASLRGYLVLTMVGLWLLLSALTVASSRRLTAGVAAVGVERAAAAARAPFAAAGVVALGLLLVGGWL